MMGRGCGGAQVAAVRVAATQVDGAVGGAAVRSAGASALVYGWGGGGRSAALRGAVCSGPGVSGS